MDLEQIWIGLMPHSSLKIQNLPQIVKIPFNAYNETKGDFDSIISLKIGFSDMIDISPIIWKKLIDNESREEPLIELDISNKLIEIYSKDLKGNISAIYGIVK